MVITGTLCTCPLDLIASMLLWMNTIRTLSAQYVWVGCILDLALDYHTFMITNGQLEPTNWQMPAQYTAPYLIMSSTIGFVALKRPRSDTSYTSNTCRKFNSRGCDDTACKYPHKCSKRGKDHTASSKACAWEQQGEPYEVGSSLTTTSTLIIRLGPRPNTSPLFPTFVKAKALHHSPSPLGISAWHSLLSNYPGSLSAILVGILTYGCEIGAESIPTLRSYRNHNSS